MLGLETGWSFFGHISNIKQRHVFVPPANDSNEPYRVDGLRQVSKNPDTLVYFLPAGIAEYYIAKYALKPKGRNFYYSRESFRFVSACDFFPKNFDAKD